MNATTSPTWVGDAHDLDWIPDESYDLVILDPPYSAEESDLLYSTPPPRWGAYTAEAIRVCRTGGHVAIYLDRQPPRPGKREQRMTLVQRIVILTRAQHKARICFVFRKGDPQTEFAIE